ncbi:Phosphonoacetaldehyde hydrolase [Bremerella volcania]|uniref:phosphonoacetaldehyde hydrolase n=1 Tax=Bremerella volcania TaxID=2527984 RepID=A0A518C9L6_9BACT|nr:phosphonoacetaldehyde hydrolase [Bremerella volcania]QDU75926.1 Phosphonoacetaldehyde hydrolase [Bremerella volcania]
MEPTNTAIETSARLVIFDWAGTMIDFGCQAPVEVLLALFEQRGVPVSTAQAREPMGAAKRDHIAAILAMPEVADRWEARFGARPVEADVDAIYADFLPLQKQILSQHAGAIPGAVEVLNQLHEQGIQIGSTTGYTRELMDVLLPFAISQGITPDYVLTSDEVAQGRPAPDMIQKIMSLSGITDPAQVVKVDDTPVGITAGKRAGCVTVALAASGNELGLTQAEFETLSPEERHEKLEPIRVIFREAEADFVIDTIADLPAILPQI